MGLMQYNIAIKCNMSKFFTSEVINSIVTIELVNRPTI